MHAGLKAICILFLLINVHSCVDDYIYNVSYIEVPLDHYSFSNNYTFKLRYLVNDSHWNGDGPIFFYTGNEGDITMFAQNTGFMWEIAPEYRALIIFAEHRYYGESLPFGNKSFDKPEYSGYLTSSQALADYVYLINYLQESNKQELHANTCPVIAFGGSYGGMLAAWLRIKYPATVIGAIAASAPIFQFSDLIPCDTYNRILTDVYRTATPFICDKIIFKSWSAIKDVTSTDEGRSWLAKTWNLCKPLTNDNDIKVLFNWIENVYSNMAMANYPYPANFLAELPAYPVKKFCYRLFTNFTDYDCTSEELVVQLGHALSIYTNYTGETECINIRASADNKLGERGWDFQACTEIIMPICSKKYDMFRKQEWNFTKFSQDCYKRWNVRVNRDDLAVMEYGGKELHAASNIVFSNGLLDPWSGGGVLQNLSKTLQSILIPDGAHHLDLRASDDADPLSVINARNFHRHSMYKWLNEFYVDNYNIYRYTRYADKGIFIQMKI